MKELKLNGFSRWVTDGDVEITDLPDTDYVEVCFNYPRLEGKTNYVHIELCDVRAADGIRVSYDFERDGWKIEQAQRFSWEYDDLKCGDPDWKEVQFIQAWGSKIPGPGDD